MTTIKCSVRLMCVTGTWLPSSSDVILISHHYVVICTLVKIFNWWLSSKDMKHWVLIKELLSVFHWLTSRIILLCSLASGHRALFWYTRQLKNHYIYVCTRTSGNVFLFPRKLMGSFALVRSNLDIPTKDIITPGTINSFERIPLSQFF